MLPPKKLGKYFWTTLHLTALGFPESPTTEDRLIYKQYFEKFGQVLPCIKCKNNYARHFGELPIDVYLFGRAQLFDWSVKFHNIVNKELHKHVWTYDEAWNWYTQDLYNVGLEKEVQGGGSGKMDYNSVLLLLNIVLLIVLCIMFAYKCHAIRK